MRLSARVRSARSLLAPSPLQSRRLLVLPLLALLRAAVLGFTSVPLPLSIPCPGPGPGPGPVAPGDRVRADFSNCRFVLRIVDVWSMGIITFFFKNCSFDPNGLGSLALVRFVTFVHTKENSVGKNHHKYRR